MKKLTFIFLLLSVLTHAAVRTTTQSGNWDAACPGAQCVWDGGTPFALGDSASIQNGHTITIPVGVTAIPGESPADDTGTKAISCASGTGTGVLVVSGTLIFRGPVMGCASVWTISPGATLTHDSSQATTPSTANYKWRISGANTQTSAYLNAIGTAGSRITVNIASGSGVFGGFAPYIDAGADGNLTIKYADISNCGTAGGACIQIYPFTCSTTVVRGLIMQNFTVTDSSNINVTNALGSCTVELDSGVFKGTTNTSGWAFRIGSTAMTTALATNGARKFRNLFSDGGTLSFGGNVATTVDMGFDFKNLYLRGGTGAVPPMSVIGNITTGENSSFDLGFLESRRQSSSGDGGNIPAGIVTRLIATRNWGANAHFVVPMARTTAVDGWIEWNSVSDASNGGDGFMVQPQAAAGNYTISFKNGVMLPQPDGSAFGLIVSHNGSGGCSGANCPQITFDKNTYVTNTTTTGQLGVSIESNNSYAGVFDSVRSNIAHRPTNGNGYLVKWGEGLLDVVNDVFEVVDYNWTHNITTTQSTKYGSELGAYAEYVGNNPGVHDSSGNPLWVDTTRTPLSYGQRWDPTIATMDDLAAKFEACYRFRANGTTSCDPRFNLADMYNWIRAGWRARNPSTWTAAHDGSHVGGVAPFTKFGVLAQ